MVESILIHQLCPDEEGGRCSAWMEMMVLLHHLANLNDVEHRRTTENGTDRKATAEERRFLFSSAYQKRTNKRCQISPKPKASEIRKKQQRLIHMTTAS